MKEIHGELWSHYAKPNTTVLITTNGIVTKDGRAVMGRGCALEAKNRFPGIDVELGRKIAQDGNVMHALDGGLIYSFPVKEHWRDNADLHIIALSAAFLAGMATVKRLETFVLPRPGCGNGRLLWRDVGKLLRLLLPDNVLVITNDR